MDETIKNINKYFKTLKKYLQQKHQKKKYFTKFLEGIFAAKIANTNFFFFFLFPLYKRVRYKNGSNIS